MNKVADRRLPVNLIVRRSFFYAWESRAVLFRPCAIYAAVTIGAELLLLAILGHKSKTADYGLIGAEELLALSFAVGIHRFVLLGETTTGPAFFRLDRHLLQYTLLAVLLLVLGLVASTPGLMIMGSAGSEAEIAASGPSAMIATAVMVVAAVVICRLMMTLPAAALGDPTPTRTIWRASTGNGFRIFAAMLLTMLPFLVIGAVLNLFMQGAPDGSPPSMTLLELFVTVAVGLISPLQIVVGNITLALCYDVLVRGGGPSAR